MKYEIGWHSEDNCHVALVDHEGKRDELFDVALYDPEVIEDDGRNSREVSLAALETLVERANAALGHGCTCDDVRSCSFCADEADKYIGARVKDDLHEFVVTHTDEKDGFPTIGGDHYWSRPDDVKVIESGHYCQNCEWRGPTSALGEAQDLDERVAPGESHPSGECPECGALTQPSFPEAACDS